MKILRLSEADYSHEMRRVQILLTLLMWKALYIYYFTGNSPKWFNYYSFLYFKRNYQAFHSYKTIGKGKNVYLWTVTHAPFVIIVLILHGLITVSNYHFIITVLSFQHYPSILIKG